MYRIQKTTYGVKFSFEGVITKEEIKKWFLDADQLLTILPKKFSVFVDMRKVKPISYEAQEYIINLQKIYKKNGLVRSVIILDDIITTMQFQRIAKKTGIYQFERYIASSSLLNWEETGMNWILKGIDPDL